MMQVLPRGPAEAMPQTAIIDRTQVLDAAELWPDALQCPDWPIIAEDQRRFMARVPHGREDAEERLQFLGSVLNRGLGILRAPTKEERDDLVSSTFRRGHCNNPTWYALGINMSPLNHNNEDAAKMIVEAAHIRGYLRKLEAATAREIEDRQREAERQARQTLANYRAFVPTSLDEIAALKEAADRHQQRLDDEKAFERRRALRLEVSHQYGHAVGAAHKLGLSVPDAPELED